MNKSFVDFMEGSMAGPDFKGQENLDMQGGFGPQPRSIQNNYMKSPFATKSLRTIDQSPNSILETAQDANAQMIGDYSN